MHAIIDSMIGKQEETITVVSICLKNKFENLLVYRVEQKSLTKLYHLPTLEPLKMSTKMYQKYHTDCGNKSIIKKICCEVKKIKKSLYI